MVMRMNVEEEKDQKKKKRLVTIEGLLIPGLRRGCGRSRQGLGQGWLTSNSWDLGRKQRRRKFK